MFFLGDRNVPSPTVELNGVERSLKSERFDAMHSRHSFKCAQNFQTNALSGMGWTDINSLNERRLWVQLTECDDTFVYLFDEHCLSFNRGVVCLGGSRRTPVFYLFRRIMQRRFPPNCGYARL